MDSIIADVMPDYVDQLNGIIGTLVPFFPGGVLVAVIAWAFGIAVYTAFRWLNSWTR